MNNYTLSSVCKKRSSCRLCLSENIELAIPFKPTVLAEKYVDTAPPEGQIAFPVDLYMCLECGSNQILDVIDPKYLWSDYTYHSGQTQGIIDHFREVSNNILALDHLSNNNFVIDVGSNDGTFLKNFKDQGFKVLGIDPAEDIANKATESGIPTIAELMDLDAGKKIVSEHGKAGIVTAFNVFAHADDMIGLVKGIHEVLDPNGVFICEVSYLLDIIEDVLIGTIFHEHLCNHSLTPLKKFLETHGLEIFDLEHVSIQGGSLICYAQHIGAGRTISANVENQLKIEQEANLHSLETMLSFTNKLNQQIAEVHNILGSEDYNNQLVYGYGAARCGPMLVNQFGLTDVLQGVFDDHPQKLGKLTPGDFFPVVATSQLVDLKPKLVVVLAWIHAKKIVQKHIDYIEQGGAFLLITPTVVLVTKDNYKAYV